MFSIRRLISYLVAVLALASCVGTAAAQNVSSGVRYVYTTITAANLVEDCWFCSPPDQIYFIGIGFRARFGDPDSVFVTVQDTRDTPFKLGQQQLNDFGDYVFTQDPEDPALLVPGIEFVDDESQPMLFGTFVTMLERNASLSRDAVLSATREAVEEVLVPILREEVGEQGLSASDFESIARIARNVSDRAERGMQLGIDDVLEEQLASGFNPDHRLGAILLFGTAFANQATADRVQAASNSSQFFALSINDIGNRLFERRGWLHYEAQRLTTVRASYELAVSGMALE